MEDLRPYGNKRVYMFIGTTDAIEITNKFITEALSLNSNIQPYYFLDPLVDIANIGGISNFKVTCNSYWMKFLLGFYKADLGFYCNDCLIDTYEDFKRSDYDLLFINMIGMNDAITSLYQRALDAETVLISNKANENEFPKTRIDYSFDISLNEDISNTVKEFCDFIISHNF